MMNILSSTTWMISICLASFFFSIPNIFSQSLISGVINQYTSVSVVNAGTSTLTVGDASLFAFDDRVLLIQMQGAAINSGNSSSFGTISNLNGAGAYEFAAVCEVDLGSNEIILQKPLVNSYNPLSIGTASIQLVTVPQYADVNIVGTLMSQPWNGSTGGIIAFEATGTVRLEADIDVSGAGFRGSGFEQMNPSCNFLTNSNDWYYSQASILGGKKGEGIAAFISGREYGRGPQATGGGGGNNHNAGGAGGGNYTPGGQGGDRDASTFSCQGNHEGEGGVGLSSQGYSIPNPYVYMGGGGGSGHGNNNQGEAGGNGGGILMIRCQTFNGNNFSILANGVDAIDAGSDGGSGGGAGGVIMLSADFYTGDPFTLAATGGDGGNTSINCEGPGGGGAGGLIWVSNALGAGVTRNVSAGAAGIATGNGCGNSPQGANNGSPGTELVTLNLTENTGTATCVLPLTLASFDAKVREERVHLNWQSLQEEVGTRYSIERSQDGQTFEELASVQGQSIASEGHSYHYVDVLPYPIQSWYRLSWQESSGAIGYSHIEEVHMGEGKPLSVHLFPNPLTTGDQLHGWIETRESGSVSFRIFSFQGQLLATKTQAVSTGRSDFKLETKELPAAMYFLRITSQHGEIAHSFLIKY